MAVDVGQKRISLSMKQETEESVAPGSRGQRAGGPRGVQHAAPRREAPIQAHATLADLKAKLAGKTPQQAQKKPVQVQVGKMNSMLKQIMKFMSRIKPYLKVTSMLLC